MGRLSFSLPFSLGIKKGNLFFLSLPSFSGKRRERAPNNLWNFHFYQSAAVGEQGGEEERVSFLGRQWKAFFLGYCPFFGSPEKKVSLSPPTEHGEMTEKSSICTNRLHLIVGWRGRGEHGFYKKGKKGGERERVRITQCEEIFCGHARPRASD